MVDTVERRPPPNQGLESGMSVALPRVAGDSTSQHVQSRVGVGVFFLVSMPDVSLLLRYTYYDYG